MQSTYFNREIVWAKVKGYPWWPAEISKLPSPQNNVFKVIFIAQDTHAFLNSKDIKKYQQFHDECSKKKMRGLAPAIQIADELYKKRLEAQSKNRSPAKGKISKLAKTKGIAKRKLKKKSDSENESDESQDNEIQKQIESQKILESDHIQKQKVQSKNLSFKNGFFKAKKKSKKEQADLIPKQSCSQGQKFESEPLQQQSSEKQSEKLQSQQKKIDRTRIEAKQNELLNLIDEIKSNIYKPNHTYFISLQSQNLTGQQLHQSRITNMLAYLFTYLKKVENQSKEVKQCSNLIFNLRKEYKQKIIDYLTDTTYYDQYLKIIQKNRKSRNDYENKLVTFMKNNYKIKKELAILFASRIASEVAEGTITKQRQLLEDLKEKKLDLGYIVNKAAIDRAIEILNSKYQ